jgi:hypothetical protein
VGLKAYIQIKKKHEVERGRIAGEQERLCADVWLMSQMATGICLVGEETHSLKKKETHSFGLRKKKNVIYSQIYCVKRKILYSMADLELLAHIVCPVYFDFRCVIIFYY